MNNPQELVTNDFTQRIFREEWQKRNVTTSGFLSLGRMKEFILAFTCTFLVPIFPILHLLIHLPMKYLKEGKQAEITSHSKTLSEDGKDDSTDCWQNMTKYYSVPKNRCIGAFQSHVILVVLLILAMANPQDQPKEIDADWYDVLLTIWCIGYCIQCLRESHWLLKDSCKQLYREWNISNNRWNTLKRTWAGQTDAYKLTQFICCLLILIGQTCKLHGFQWWIFKGEDSLVSENISDDPLEHCDRSVLKAGYAFVGIGATLCILNLLHWFELSSKVGPIILSLFLTLGDILRILITYVVMLLAFSVGLHYSLKFSSMYCEGESTKEELRLKYKSQMKSNTTCGAKRIETKMEGFSLEDNVNHFRDFQESVKTCFWSVFDPGHPEVIGCTLGPPRYLVSILKVQFMIHDSF